MKYIIALSFFFGIAIQGNAQKVYDPCQKMDTNQMKQMVIGKWIDVADTNHWMVITEDSLEEQIVVGEGVSKKVNMSYFNYTFTDNKFSSDDVTCYSFIEYLPGDKNKSEVAINSISHDYLMLGATGKKVFKRRN